MVLSILILLGFLIEAVDFAAGHNSERTLSGQTIEALFVNVKHAKSFTVEHTMTKYNQMIHINMESCVISSATLILSGCLMEAVGFAAGHPAFVRNAISLSAAAVGGLWFIYSQVKEFGALVYGHPITGLQIIGFALVLGRLFYKQPKYKFFTLTPKQWDFLGIKRLWDGNFINCSRYFPTQAFKLDFKDTFRKMFMFFMANLVSGGLSAAGSLTIVYPLQYAHARDQDKFGVQITEQKKSLDSMEDLKEEDTSKYEPFWNSYAKHFRANLISSTSFDTQNSEAAIVAVDKYFNETGKECFPVMLSATTVDNSERTLSGQTIEAFFVNVEHAKPSTGLEYASLAARLRLLKEDKEYFHQPHGGFRQAQPVAAIFNCTVASGELNLAIAIAALHVVTSGIPPPSQERTSETWCRCHAESTSLMESSSGGPPPAASGL